MIDNCNNSIAWYCIILNYVNIYKKGSFSVWNAFYTDNKTIVMNVEGETDQFIQNSYY